MAEKEESVKKYSTREIAQLFGVTSRRIQQLTADGTLKAETTSKGRCYDMEQTVKDYISFLSDKAYGRETSDTEIKLKEQKLRAEVALKESQGELHKLRTDIAVGRYISIEKIKIDYSRFFVSFKTFALSIPSRVSGKLTSRIEPVEARALEQELQAEITELLSNFTESVISESSSTVKDGTAAGRKKRNGSKKKD